MPGGAKGSAGSHVSLGASTTPFPHWDDGLSVGVVVGLAVVGLELGLPGPTVGVLVVG